ncbi:DUF4824 family protein [Pseudomonas sp. GD03944]|uniref:DUF4824 family protein n=1 Tax=Pseudomonas sp. GD03944 TaxID=2975409 RepID=UPI00244D509D|nr:DUF4824 family protein [Pseudomonas sp. GD03944]MDH1264554.1 DUF4824 family protein [Pseudomonas sp. GD03944]
MSRPGVRGWLWLSLGLILLSNAVALAGVYYNRSGEPQSVLTLSERELMLSRGLWLDRETDGVLHLQLMWREEGNQGEVIWLDRSKLLSLGFVVPAVTDTIELEFYRRNLERSVWLVLELDGPAYQRELKRTRQALEKAEARLQALPDDEALQHRRDRQREYLEDEEHHSSRLFLVDAGLDVEALRAQYPDRRRYALIAGYMRPYYRSDKDTPLFSASIRSEVAEISVPFALREVFSTWNRHQRYGEQKPKVRAEIAFGQRYEPWMIDAVR